MRYKYKTKEMPLNFIKYWHVLVDNLPYPIIIQDTELNILIANPAFKKLYPDAAKDLLEKQKERISNKNFLKTPEFEHPSPIEIYDPVMKKYFLIHTSHIIEKDDFIGTMHSFLDITDFKNNIQEIQKREESAVRSRDAFLNMLEDVTDSYKELEGLFVSLVNAMVNALDAKSEWTKGHSERVGNYAQNIAQTMGFDETTVKNCRLAGLLHDIGKIGTYDYLLDKPQVLTPSEFETVKRHPTQGANIIRDIKQLKEIVPSIKYHHEQIDGKGYPEGLKGDQIPDIAKIIHVADSYDAMTTDRPYRKKQDISYAVSELKRYEGIQFDIKTTEAFLKYLGL